MDPALKRPLRFGDQEQIEAIRRLEWRAEWDALSECQECEGERECTRCGQECSACDGAGKNAKEVHEFYLRHPHLRYDWEFKT
jgi:hypothetical protein